MANSVKVLLFFILLTIVLAFNWFIQSPCFGSPSELCAKLRQDLHFVHVIRIFLGVTTGMPLKQDPCP